MGFSRNTKSTLSLLLFLAALGAVGYYFYYLSARSFVPAQFTEARINGSKIAQEIVSSTEESLKNLNVISEEDRKSHPLTALNLVNEELERAKESRKKAISLTGELDVMARFGVQIVPVRARNLAMEAISHEISLVSHLIVYNDVLNGLLQTLEFKFSGDISGYSNEVQNLVKSMNAEAEEINNLNKLFNEKMKEFDSLTG